MEFRQIQYFLALYEERSVTRAAHRLNIVQPALSMQITKLEENWGHPLFIRNARGMTPTPVADQMYKLFLPIVADFHKAKDYLNPQSGTLSGQVRVGMIESMAKNILVETVLSFQRSHPMVSLSVHEGRTESLVQATTAGLLDVTFTHSPKRVIGLEVELLLSEPMLLVVGKKHHTLPKQISLECLATLNLALPTHEHGLRRLIDQWAQDLEICLVPAIEIDMMFVMAGLVAGGGYAAFMPESVVRGINAEQNLFVHTIDAPSFSRQLVSVKRSSRPITESTQAFVSLLKRNLKEKSLHQVYEA